jgi:hypothetical protein
MTTKDKLAANRFRAWVWRTALDNAVPLFLLLCSVGLFIASNSLSYFKELAERNTYTVESINRQVLAGDTYTLLLRASKDSKGSTETFFADSAPCNEQTRKSNSITPAEAGVLARVTPPGLYSTVRYHRGPNTTSVSFRLTSGKFVFVGTVGDLPQKICFNEKRDVLNITYADAFTDVGHSERILFLQSDDPGGDIVGIGMTLRSDQYIWIAAIVVLFFIVLLAAVFFLIFENGRKDKRFRADFISRYEDLRNSVLQLISISEKISEFVTRSVVSSEKDSTKNFNVDLSKLVKSVSQVDDGVLLKRVNTGTNERKNQTRSDNTPSSRILDLKSRLKAGYGDNVRA